MITTDFQQETPHRFSVSFKFSITLSVKFFSNNLIVFAFNGVFLKAPPTPEKMNYMLWQQYAICYVHTNRVTVRLEGEDK